MNFVIGAKIGMLLLVEFLGRDKHSKKQWLCKCDCGNMAIRTEGNLKTTKIPHCGCSPGWKGHNKRFTNISGQKFGRLTVRFFYGKDKYSHNQWFCDCECGGHTITGTQALIGGRTQSCGCLANELTVQRSTTHGKTHHRLYRIYAHMKERCYDEKCKDHKDYGGRGIRICDEWLNDFEVFYTWSIQNGYSQNLTIDRIDVDGNYEPRNCRWVSRKIQSYNKRNSIVLEYNNESHTLKEWSNITGIRYITLYQRYKKGLPIEKILRK